MKTIKRLSAKTSLSALALLMASSPLMAQELSITLSNLTQGLHFTPVITAAHTSEAYLFKSGMAATPELQMMAEKYDAEFWEFDDQFADSELVYGVIVNR